MSLDVKYIRAIHAAGRANGADREAIHEAIAAGYGKTSIKDLTPAEAMKLLDGLNGRSLDTTDRRRAKAWHGRRNTHITTEYRISPRDMARLEKSANLRNWNADTLGDFIERQIGKRTISTIGELNKVLWPIKRMNRKDGLEK